jgi:tight adherence protein C
VNPTLTGLAITGCYLLLLRGWSMMRDAGPMKRFAAAPVDAEEASVRRSLLVRLLDRLSDRFAPRATRLLGERQLRIMQRRLNAAGRPMTLERYAGRKGVYALLFGTPGLIFLLDGDWFLFAMLVLLGFIWADIWLSGQARRRQAQIDRDLPDFLDILAVTVSAGVAFRPALMRVSEALGGPLAEEVMTALRQMDLGLSRRDAFEALRSRNLSESLGVFVTALLQAEELGVPLADALTDLAADMRRTFHQEARRRASRAAPRVSLITTTVIVPGAVVLIIAGLFVGTGVDIGNLLGE